MSQIEVEIKIGNNSFEVACQEGEQQFLLSAASLLDAEAQVLVSQIGRMPETRLLLMSGLMLADKTASFEDQVAAVKAQLAEREAELEGLRNMTPPEPERVEVPVIPDSVTDTLAEIAARAESIAAEMDEKLS